jgi:hypothetical protein
VLQLQAAEVSRTATSSFERSWKISVLMKASKIPRIELNTVNFSGVPRGLVWGVQIPPSPKFRNFDKVPKIKKILLYEMKFLVPNYSCLQNP